MYYILVPPFYLSGLDLFKLDMLTFLLHSAYNTEYYTANLLLLEIHVLHLSLSIVSHQLLKILPQNFMRNKNFSYYPCLLSIM